MNFQQDSSYHHQSFQSIINQQSLPTYLLDAFCNHWDFCSLPRLLQHLDSHQSPSTISSAIQRLNLFQSSPDFHRILECTSHTPDDTLLVYDLGASAGLTPFKSDFFDYVKCSIPVRDISKVNEVIGIGTTIHKFVDTKGRFVYLPQVAYHLPSSEVCLFSPQVFHQSCGGKSIIFGDRVEIHLTNRNQINIPIDVFESNVPIVRNSMCTEAEKKEYGFSLGGKVNFAGRRHFTDALIDEDTSTKETLDHEFSTYSKICCPCVGTTSNANLSGPQKELLLWHWKLGISMYRIQELMRPIKAHESSGVCHEMPPVINPIFKSTPNLKTPPLCQSCQLACSKRRVPKVNQPMKACQD